MTSRGYSLIAARVTGKRQQAVYGLSAALVAALMLAGSTCRAAERLTVGNTPTLLTGLLTLASVNNSAAEEGLALRDLTLATGDDGLQALKAGKLDVYAVSDITFIKHHQANPGLRLIASLGEWDNETKIIARPGSGIRAFTDLRGKRIAAQQGLAFHYFLDLVLARNGWDESSIQPVFMHTRDQPMALARGEIDAAVTREPYLGRIAATLGPGCVTLEAPGLMIKRFVLVTSERHIRERRAAIVALLRALVRAERRLIDDPAMAARQLATALKEDPAEVGAQIKGARLRLTLTDHLLYTLEKASRWTRRVEGGNQAADVNYLNAIETGPLSSVKPEAVSLYH